jgi:short-subunit dehydrogenase involved in D-alanine esterification of teichoic acids
MKANWLKLSAIFLGSGPKIDLTNGTDREELIRWTRKQLPGLNVLINNGAVVRKVDLRSDACDFGDIDAHLVADLLAPIYQLGVASEPAQTVAIDASQCDDGTHLQPDASTPRYLAAKPGCISGRRPSQTS